MDDRKVKRIINLTDHLKQLLLTEVHDDRALSTSRPMPHRLRQNDNVDFLYFLSEGHRSPV